MYKFEKVLLLELLIDESNCKFLVFFSYIKILVLRYLIYFLKIYICNFVLGMLYKLFCV